MNFLVACNYPGGVNAVLPVAIKLDELRHNVIIVTSISNKKIVGHIELHTIYFKRPASFSELLSIYERFNIDYTITGTSESEDKNTGRIESNAILVSNKLNVPSLSVIDCWHKYKERFSLSSKKSLDALPNKICVIDERSKLSMVKEGFAEEALHITGNPHWDNLKAIRSKLIKSDSDSEYILGYTEEMVLKDIIKLIKNTPLLSNLRILLKKHPRDSVIKYKDIISNSSVPVCTVEDRDDIYSLANGALFTIGMFSMLLTEIYLLGLKVISYQPVNKYQDIIDIGLPKECVTDRLSSEKDITNMINKIGLSMNSRIDSATNNVLNVIFDERADSVVTEENYD